MVHFSVDPEHPANETIADIKMAPRDGDGRVAFSSDFRVVQPVDPQRGNGRMLLDILNRGKATALRNLNSAPDVLPSDPLDPGNGFLMRQGYSVVWCGWQHDAPSVPGVLGMRAPGAVDASGPISGRIVVTFQNNAPTQVQLLSDRNHQAYPANNLEDPDAVMTVQEHEDAPEAIVPRDRWSFARLENGQVVPDARHVYCAAGFEPGKVYQVIYSTTGAPVVGLGLLATRDIAAFLRYGGGGDDNVCPGGLERAYTFGVSQSGRFLRLYLYLGLNVDEAGRVVFDGFMPHVAGGKRGEFNQRFAQPSSQASRSTNSLFPFTDVSQTDSETGLTDGLLTRLSAIGELPKIMYTYTPSEYWGGHGSLATYGPDGNQGPGPPGRGTNLRLCRVPTRPGGFPTNRRRARGQREERASVQLSGPPPHASSGADQPGCVGNVGTDPAAQRASQDIRRHGGKAGSVARDLSKDSGREIPDAAASIHAVGLWTRPGRSNQNTGSGGWRLPSRRFGGG